MKKIGIIGAMGDCYSSIASEQSKDIFFKTDIAFRPGSIQNIQMSELISVFKCITDHRPDWRDTNTASDKQDIFSFQILPLKIFHRRFQ
mgnify:CR=1 FL=1